MRALGPSLADDGVATPLQDPTVERVNANGEVINANDNFDDGSEEDASDEEQAEVESRGLASEDERESALFQTPGNYTAIVRGKGETISVGLVEIYNVP